MLYAYHALDETSLRETFDHTVYDRVRNRPGGNPKMFPSILQKVMPKGRLEHQAAKRGAPVVGKGEGKKLK